MMSRATWIWTTAALVAITVNGYGQHDTRDSSNQGVSRLVATAVSAPPALDGDAADAAWRSAGPIEFITNGVMPKSRGTSSKVTLRAVHTETHIYLLVQWTDATKSDAGHKTWVWDAGKKSYVSGDDREDALSLAFENTGPFTGDMLSGEAAVWDVWHWKAFRTNPQGYAMDRAFRYFKSEPALKARKHPARGGGAVWIARPEDAGNTVEKKRPAPTTFQGDRVPQYLHGTPTGSAADVKAQGTWADGRWTLELARKLATAHSDDTAFDLSRSYKLAVGVHDDTGDMDKASGVIELSFGRGAERLSRTSEFGFEDAGAGRLPAGWTVAETRGSGTPATWRVVRADAAPGGRHVLSLVGTENSGSTFNLLLSERSWPADLELSVMVRARSGQEDQGGGPVWRAKDADNYYVTRWNPLENNLRAYKVEGGRRRMLKSATVEVDPSQWHRLDVRTKGARITVSLDGRILLSLDDETFGEGGKIGFWTKADAATSFDDLKVRWGRR